MQVKTIHDFRATVRKLEREVTIGLKENPRTGGLNLVQCHTIINLGLNGETTIGGMAKELGVDKSTLSRTVEGLVNLELLDRYPHPSDRRYTLIKLTKQGEKACKKINSANDQYFQQVFNAIQTTEHENVIKYFNMFVEALLKHSENKIP
ncbi:MAG: MarR family transcriptional regulator [Deltaproteobacteria bacterium]|jgi:DNA-binding MarR family transcriptional regulator|nr:MarR family transcriptional regulator [Deltaproteobacteria bacterium]MBT4527165.1 MarR family transcriptional regulator [Deltaproteobacteria bacterium]